MLDTGYLYAKDKNRIFINTCLGCKATCSYCYLQKLGYKNNVQNLKIRIANQILDDIKNSNYEIKKTLITLGCFSECWDENNKVQTMELIKYFLIHGNQIQISTKKEIYLEEVLYMKPILQGITINDIDLYRQYNNIRKRLLSKILLYFVNSLIILLNTNSVIFYLIIIFCNFTNIFFFSNLHIQI